MSRTEEPIITEVERIDNGVMVRFSDGAATVFPAFLLRASVELADIMNESSILDVDPEPET